MPDVRVGMEALADSGRRLHTMAGHFLAVD